jgi:putative membrane protein
MKKLLIASMALYSLFAWTIVYAQDPWRDYSMRPWMMNWGFGMWWFMPFVMLAFWIVVIVGMIFFIRWLMWSSKGREIKSEETPLDILKKRYAKGEISKEDFERMKKDIS